MGGSPSGWRQNCHTSEETNATIAAYNSTKRYKDQANSDLTQIYRTLDIEQQRIQTRAFEDELRSLLARQNIEWRIFEEDVKKAQAGYISNLYTNRVLAELQNLREIVKM